MTTVKEPMLRCSARGAKPSRDGPKKGVGLLIVGRLGVQGPGSHPDPGDPGVVLGWTGPQWEFTGCPALARL